MSKVEENAPKDKEVLSDGKNPNLKFWDSVAMTDPTYTKHVAVGRGFTAIDAHYQIREATAKWGILGSGWGVETEPISDAALVDPSLVGVRVTIWYLDDSGNRCYGVPIIATSKKHFGQNADSDAFKKATTDGITKGLSYFGFNADVFLGKFDDNKYVQEVTKHFKEPVDTVDYSESKKAIQEAFDKDQKWAVSILDWAEVDSVDKMSNEQIIEVMKIIKPEGGKA